MKKHLRNLMKKGLAAALCGMMLMATITPAMAAEVTSPETVTEELVEHTQSLVNLSSDADPETVSESPAGALQDEEAPAAVTEDPVVSEQPESGEVGTGTETGSEEKTEAPESTDAPENTDAPESIGGTDDAGQPGSTDEPEAADNDTDAPQSTIELLPINDEETEETSHPLIDINEEEENKDGQAKELSAGPMTLEAHTFNGINVIVEAPAGVLPEDAHLSVFEVKSEVKREETAEKLDEAEVNYDEYMVLDISLFNSAFDKIEPEGDVSVSITMDADKLPEDVDQESLEIQHLEEDENGEVKEVVQVADTTLANEGNVEVTEENTMEATFDVGSFSKFVITWKSAGKLRMVFTAYDADNGNQAIPDFRWSDSVTGGEYTVDLIETLCGGDESHLLEADGTPRDFLLADILREYGMYQWDTYVFQRAKIGQIDNVKGFRYDPATERIKQFNDTKEGSGWEKSGGTNPTMAVQLYYTKTNLHVVPTVDSTSMGIEMYMSLHDGAGTPYYYDQRVDSDESRSLYQFAGRRANQLFYKEDDKTTGFTNGLISPRQYDATFIRTYNQYKDKVLNEGNEKNGSYWNNPGGFPWKLKLQRGMIWPSLTTRLIPEGEEFPRIDVVGRGDYMDYVRDSTGEKEFEQPLSDSNTISLKELFDPKGEGMLQSKGTSQQVNHLFREDIYEATGYFYYGSDRNHAQLNDTTSAQTDFTLYSEVATRINKSNYNNGDASYKNTFYGRRGNFLPYNHITDEVSEESTDRDMAGNLLADMEAVDPGSTELMGEKLAEKKVYKVQERPVYGFGLSMQADFVQPENGRVQWKNNPDQPMIFEFNGDDDVWVYIDDVLVLDIGGSHAAQNAVINFETGNIYWTDNGSINFGGYKVKSNQSIFNTRTDSVDDYYTVEGKSQAFFYDNQSTIRAMYERAVGKEGAEALNIWSDGNSGNTFRSGTKHTFKFYYIEHGGGASNLRLSFNIQPEPIGDLEVAKEFTEEDLTYEKMVNGVSEAVIPDDFRAVFAVYTAKLNTTTGLWEPDEFVDEAELTQETYEQGLFEKREVNGRVQYVHTFKRLALSNMYIVDEKIYKSGKGYLGDPEGTNIDLSGTKGTPQESAKDVNNAKYQLSTATAANVLSVNSSKAANFYTINWRAQNAKINLEAYYINEEGQEVRITDEEAMTRGIEENFNGSVTNNKLNGRYPQDGDEVNIEEFLNRRKLTKVGSYVFNHAEWGAALQPTPRMSALQVFNSGNGLKIVDEQGVPGGANGSNQYSNVRGNSYTIKVYYDKAFYEYRSDAFEVYGIGNKANYPATVVVENKYLTPLSIRKVLRSSMEPDLNRDFKFRIYIRNRDGSVYQPAQGLVGTVYQVIKTEDPNAPGGFKEELVEKKVPDEAGGTKADVRYLLLKNNEYYEFEIKRDEEITFALPKGLTYKVVEIIEQGYKVTGAINLKETEGANKELVLIDNEFTENEVRKKTWETEDLTFTEETLITITNSFDIARTGLSMSVLPFVLMVAFGILAIAALAVITIRRRALHMED